MVAFLHRTIQCYCCVLSNVYSDVYCEENIFLFSSDMNIMGLSLLAMGVFLAVNDT